MQITIQETRSTGKVFTWTRHKSHRSAAQIFGKDGGCENEIARGGKALSEELELKKSLFYCGLPTNSSKDP